MKAAAQNTRCVTRQIPRLLRYKLHANACRLLSNSLALPHGMGNWFCRWKTQTARSFCAHTRLICAVHVVVTEPCTLMCNAHRWRDEIPDLYKAFREESLFLDYTIKSRMMNHNASSVKIIALNYANQHYAGQLSETETVSLPFCVICEALKRGYYNWNIVSGIICDVTENWFFLWLIYITTL